MYIIEKSQAKILYYSWADETVFFNELSGETHLFDRLSARILLVIINMAREINRSELINRVSFIFNEANLELSESFVDDFVIQCQGLHLLKVRK